MPKKILKPTDINKKKYLFREAFFMEIKTLSSEVKVQTFKKPLSIQENSIEPIKDGMVVPEKVEVKEPAKEEDIKKAVVDFNKFLGNSNTHIQYEYHEELKEHFVRLVNNTTNEVVKEIPSKKILDIHAAMREYLGFFVDKKI